jgi:hypothetical protein
MACDMRQERLRWIKEAQMNVFRCARCRRALFTVRATILPPGTPLEQPRNGNQPAGDAETSDRS